MGFLSSAEACVLRGLAAAMMPPPPPDITRWCQDNIVFDERSPFPGPFNINRFPFLREIHEVLNPEHPCREVTLRGSAQFGKTVSVLIPTLAAWHEYGPLDSLVVHPTSSSATEWVRTKWMPFRRSAPSLRDVFGDGRGEQTDTLHNQETLRRDGTLKVTSAGSPDDLAGTTRRLVLMDDVAKFEMTPKGDPEQMAISRASGFDEAKIVRMSTPQVAGTCRITRAFKRSDQRHYHVPCPFCGHFAPFLWENFRRNIDPDRLHAAGFTCDECGSVIDHSHKARMVSAGRWVAHNPQGDHPGFHLWRAYVPQRDWASIAVEYAQATGLTNTTSGVEDLPAVQIASESQTEQTFWNDVLGLPFEQATKGPDWEKLRDRVESCEDGTFLPMGRVPACGVILAAGVDCQLDRLEVTIAAFGRQHRRWVIEHRIIPYHIGDEEGRHALDALLKSSWRTTLGQPLTLDILAIDEGAYTDAVLDWAKRHPWARVITVKGSSSANGPTIRPQTDRKVSGRVVRNQRRRWLLNVSQMKADFYGWLEKVDPAARGFVSIARGIGDEYFRQITAEVRVLKRGSSGVMVSRWELVEPTRRNEALDTMISQSWRASGWTSMTDEQWGVLEAERSIVPSDGQPDLFDAAVPVVPLSTQATATVPRADPAGAPAAKPEPAMPWIPTRKNWI
ncbi:phage terminase large subunit family protein [Roseicitreum antarcticum]|uniref:phage terminase large subunit family protein n=1 Tax=Roseicitreum antarcticum TaxID=564137 RepID=UPI0016808E4B|nr:terminase gpA endonuclease subunit [Roseicitreum antarcticum]